MLGGAILRVSDAAWGTGILTSELHLFALCLLPVFVSFRDRAACGMKEFTHKIAVQSDCVTRCIALADWSVRKSLDVGSSAGVYASAAFAFFRALGPMVAALSALNQHAAAPSWKCSVDSQKSDCGGSMNVASKSQINERSSAFFSELELWRGDPRAHIAADSCGVSLSFSENLKNFLSAWIVGGSAGGLRGLIERHAPVLSSTEQFADNLHRTLYFCANECHPSAARPGIEYCAYLLNVAAVSDDACLNFDGPCSAIFDGVARYFAHGLREMDFIDSLNGNDPSPSIMLRLHHVLADIQSTQHVPLKLMSPYAAAAFLTALCRTQGFSRKTLPLLPTASLAERCTCSVGLKHIWSRMFVALQQSESCDATLLLRNVLCCIVVHDSFYFGSVCQGIKDVNLLQPSSLVDSMFFATTRAPSASLSSFFSDVIKGLSVLLADLRTLCSTFCSIPAHSCDSILHQMFSICVIANKNLACAFRRPDCIDMASVKLSALWSDDALFNAETWTPHPIFKFICSEMMPFLLDYASNNHLLHADTTCCFKLDDWCHVLLLILSNINIIRRCPPCPAEMQLLFSGVFPILDCVSDSTSLQPLLQLLVDVVSISLQPALISSTCSIMKIEPIPHISTSFFRSFFKMLIRVCRESLQVGSGVCQLVAQSFVELLLQSFNATMTQQRASTAKRMYSLWQDLDPQSQFRTKHHNMDLIVRAEIWPIVLTHSLDIDFFIWSEHICLMCTEGFGDLFVLMSSCPTAAGPGSQTRDVVVETISSLVTFSAQNLVIRILDASMPQSSIAAAEAMFMHICDRLITQISHLEESVLHVVRNSLVQMTSIFSAASSRTLGPSKFLHGRAFSATHVFSGCDKLALSYDSIATQFEDHVVFDKDLDVNTLFMPLVKKKDASTVLLDSIHIFLRDCGVVLPLLLSSGLSLHTREYCRVPKNCKPSLLQWLRWLASSPCAKDASSAAIAQDILFLLPDPDNFLTINVRPSVSYMSMKNQLHSLSTSQSSFESALHSIVDSSFYASPSLSLLTNCSSKGKFCIFRAAYIEAISLPSELISKSFSFLLFLLGRPGQRINMSNPAVQQGLFPTEDVIKSNFHSRLEQLIKDLLYAADFESLPGDPTSNASSPALQVFTPKAGSLAKASLLMEFLSSSPCITAIYHDLLALEFLLLRPPHMDYDTVQESFHCASFLNDLFNHIKHQQADHRIRYCPAVVEVFDFVDLAVKAVVDVGNWIDAIGSVANTDAVMWLVNSRLIIHLHRHVNLCFDVLSPLIVAVDASALPVNISTLCGLFGVLFRLLSVIIQWKLNINTESALATCTSFLKCIATYQDGFSDNAYSKTPIMRRNCQVSDISLFSESARAATHMLSLLFTNHYISTRDVVTHISQVLNALHRVQPVVSSDFVLTTVANVCCHAVGIPPENILKNGNVLQVTKEYQSMPTTVILLKIRELLVALCGGASIAMSKCATALSLLLFTQTSCPVLSIEDRIIVANVCALALQVNFSTEAESLILMNYQVWNAAAGLARSLLADEFEQSSAVISSFLHAVPVIVQSLGFMLQNEPGAYETLSDTALVALCCDNGIKLLNSCLRILASGPVRIESIVPNAFLSLLKLACSANVSSIDLRNQISGQVRKFYRSRWLGIANLGNTCYAASVVQLLVSIPSFIAVLFESSLGPLAGNPSQALVRSLQGFTIAMSDLSQNQSPFLQPHDLYSRCIISSSNVLQIADTTAQSQDAAEFFVAIMNQLNVETSLSACLDTARSSPRMCAASLPVISSRVADLFAVSITEKCDWPACGCSRKQTEDSVLLPAEGLVTIDDSGKSFSSMDAVLASHFSSNHALRCCSCDTEQATQCTATKRITRVSDILVLQLRCNTSDGAYVKIFEQPSFPLHLDVRHVTDAVDETEYELEGVVLHHGLNMSTGHYTVLVRHKCASDHIWGLHLNDANVPEHVTHSVMNDITSRDGRRIDLEKGNLVYSGKPYLLFYVRKHHQRAQPAMAFLAGALFPIENLCISLTTFHRRFFQHLQDCKHQPLLR
jgi:ubiquitin C-terminal hydrolase